MDDQRGVDVVGRHTGLVRRTALISLLTLASRIIGFARETLAAALFGDRSPVNDAFVTAWRVPNLFRAMLGEGAISTAMQAALTKADAEGGLAHGRELFRGLVRTLTWILIAVCGVLMLAAWFLPDRMPFTDFAWLGADPGPVRELLVRLLPFVILVCLSGVCSGALNVRGHYLAPSLGPVLMNVGWIGALFVVASHFGWSRAPGASDAADFERQMSMARALSLFLLAAGSMLLVVQLPALVAHGFVGGKSTQPRAKFGAVWAILKSSAPLAFGAAVYQVNVLVDGLMAESLLSNGGPSVLYWAQRLQQLPLSLVAVAATSAVFPLLTALGQAHDRKRLRELHDDTHLAIAFVAVPATVGLFFLTEPIVSLCFRHGAFGDEGVARTVAALHGLTAAILPAGAAGLVARTYYALGDYRTPVRVAVLLLIANSVLNWIFVRGLGMDVGGLTWSTAIIAWVNLLVLLPGLSRGLELPRGRPDVGRRLLQIGGASLVAGLAALGVWSWLATRLGAPLALAAAIACSLGTYAGACEFLGVPEWRRATSRWRQE